MAQGAQPVRGVGSSSWLRVATAVALAIAVAVAVWLIVRTDDRKPAVPSPAGSAATVSTIRAVPGQVGHDVYWAGQRPDVTYELTEIDRNLFIRYLPLQAHVGDPRPDFLTVGTYVRAGAYADLRRQVRRRGNRSRRLSGRGLAVWSTRLPQRIRLAYPGVGLRIEVYDPSAARALELVTSGAIEPIR
jgi:hypothetical protein